MRDQLPEKMSDWHHAFTEPWSHPTPSRQRYLLALLSFSIASVAHGAEIRSVDFEHDGNRYTLVSDTHFDAEPENIFAVLTDYDHIAQISETIKESRYLDPGDDGQALVFTRIGSCVLFFCKTVEKVERVESIRPTYIQTTAIPERSNVRYSKSEWVLTVDEGGGTKVIYRVEFEPDFWVPPVIGPLLIKHALIEEGATAVQQIELMAQQCASSAAQPQESATGC